MRRWLPLAVLALATAAAVAAGAAYAADRGRPALTEAEAKAFTRRAFAAAGLDVELRTPVRRTRFRAGPGRQVPVWVVPVAARGERLELTVPVRGDQALHLDDGAAEGGVVLSDEEFRALDRFELDLAGERERERRLGPAAVAGLAAVGSATAALGVARSGRVTMPVAAAPTS